MGQEIVSYYAAVCARGRSGWSATELDLDDVEDIETVGDLTREVDPDADLSLLLVESDDEYFAVVRVDDGGEIRVFGSDAEFADYSRLGSILLSDTEPVTVVPARRPASAPRPEFVPGGGAAAAGTKVEDSDLDDAADDDGADDESADFDSDSFESAGFESADADDADSGQADDSDAAEDDTEFAGADDSRAGGDDEGDSRPVIGGDPVGDADIVDDLGTSAAELIKFCTDAGMLPGDILAEVCLRAGCGEAYNELRDL